MLSTGVVTTNALSVPDACRPVKGNPHDAGHAGDGGTSPIGKRWRSSTHEKRVQYANTLADDRPMQLQADLEAARQANLSYLPQILARQPYRHGILEVQAADAGARADVR
jgi:hypothetical protein